MQIFGEDGFEALLKVMKKLHIIEVEQPYNSNVLAKKENKKSLKYLMFLEQNHCIRIKGRRCSDGRNQRIYKTKEETISPTVATDSMLLSCVIDAKDNWYIVTWNIPGLFMQSDMYEMICFILNSTFYMLLTQVGQTNIENTKH